MRRLRAVKGAEEPHPLGSPVLTDQVSLPTSNIPVFQSPHRPWNTGMFLIYPGVPPGEYKMPSIGLMARVILGAWALLLPAMAIAAWTYRPGEELGELSYLVACAAAGGFLGCGWFVAKRLLLRPPKPKVPITATYRRQRVTIE